MPKKSSPSPNVPNAPKAYLDLLEKLIEMFALAQPDAEENPFEVQRYWEMGRRILEVEQNGEVRAAYGKHILKNLSNDLKQHTIKGVSVRSLQFMRKFYSEYDTASPGTQLTWSHYKLLLSVSNRQQRTALEQRSLREHLSKSALGELTQLARFAAHSKSPAAIGITPRNGEFDICKIVVRRDGRLRRTLLDVGFHQNIEVPYQASFAPRPGDYVKCTWNKNNVHLAKSDCKRGERYCYRASLLEVIDGDTIIAEIRLPRGNSTDVRLRLRGFNAPAVTLDEGRRAKAFLEGLLPARCRNAPLLTVLTYGTDLHGRYVADIFVEDQPQRRVPSLRNDRFINRLMLQSGLAFPM